MSSTVYGPHIDESSGQLHVNYYVSNYYSEALRSTPPAYRASVLRMVEDYEAVFGGREQELSLLDDFLYQNEKQTALLLAPTGRGKTALLIHWVARIQAAQGLCQLGTADRSMA